jgi:hypothetical protein
LHPLSVQERLVALEVRHPETIRRSGHELTINEVARSMLVLITRGGDLELATPLCAGESLVLQESANRVIGNLDALALQLLSDLLGAVDTVAVGLVHAKNLGFQGFVANLARTWRTGK